MKPVAAIEPAIAVLLPCYNEELTIGDVVARFRAALPGAAIHVYDNNSSDMTAVAARAAGAIVHRERRQGKGNVVRRMFADIEADIYVMADGDGTYAPEDAPQLINTLVTEKADMVVGTRRGVTDDAGRRGHAFGNRLFNSLYQFLFGNDFSDIFSGYRAFTRRFVKSFPAVSGGFEIETEMSVHASMLKLPVCEIALDYGRRPEGSASKLSTFRDGARILWMLAMLMKETRPARFFGALAFVFLSAGIGSPFGMNFSASPLLHHRCPVGGGPSLNTSTATGNQLASGTIPSCPMKTSNRTAPSVSGRCVGLCSSFCGTIAWLSLPLWSLHSARFP
jgi:hypothetical protein